MFRLQRVFRGSRRASFMSYHKQTSSQADAFVVNLRSDTFTLPTPAMKDAMATAMLGDDVYGEDPTVNELQEDCARLLGQEAALLVPTGTMGNLAAVLSHCSGRFEEALLGDLSHINLYEVGGISTLGGVKPTTIRNKPDGTLDLEELVSKIQPRDDIHNPKTRLICLENTHNKCGGSILSIDYIKKVREIADSKNLLLHLDGARVMNAAVALGVPLADITKHFHSVGMCFSKGLSCPVGSILAGSKSFIDRARWSRKALGGGMRQAGVIAAPMKVALTEIVPKLQDDHVRARAIAQAVVDLSDEAVMTADLSGVHTNIVMLHVSRCKVTPEQVCQRLLKVDSSEEKALGERIIVQSVPFSQTALRLTTYHGITDLHVEKAIKKLQYVLTEMRDRV